MTAFLRIKCYSKDNIKDYNKKLRDFTKLLQIKGGNQYKATLCTKISNCYS